eukprot:scaffold118656_cov21-Tisochrysis_lutea.AAC.2
MGFGTGGSATGGRRMGQEWRAPGGMSRRWRPADRRGQARTDLHDARALRVAKQLDDLATKGVDERFVHRVDGGEARDEVVAKGVARERIDVRRELVACARELRLGEARQQLLE